MAVTVHLKPVLRMVLLGSSLTLLAGCSLFDRPVLGRDNPSRDGLGERERAADRDDPVAYLAGVGIAHFYRG